jgi:hypothetical protein
VLGRASDALTERLAVCGSATLPLSYPSLVHVKSGSVVADQSSILLANFAGCIGEPAPLSLVVRATLNKKGGQP